MITKKEMNKILNKIKLKKYPDEIYEVGYDKSDFMQYGFNLAINELNKLKKKIRRNT